MFMNHMLLKVSLLCGTASAASLGTNPWSHVNTPSPYLEVRAPSNSSGSYCDFGDAGAGNLTTRGVDQSLHRLIERARPLKRPSPLVEPGDNAEQFLDQLQQDAVDSGNRIEITPPKEQWEGWLVGHRSHQVPVGATAQWKPFEETPERWMMAGMSGCTGTIILSEEGLWGSHLWEALGVQKYRESTLPHKEGPSAFLRRTGEGPNDNVERPASQFKSVAIDILNQQTPADANRPLWVSFADLAQNQGDPFSDGSKVDGVILTKARSPAKTAMMYGTKINALSAEYNRLIPGSTWKNPVLYIGDKTKYPSGFPMNLAGTIGIQYTPWQRTEDENRVARVEVYAENNPEPVIVKEWVRNP